MAVKLTFEIELQSDYHSGAGYGLGSVVDAALLRDGDGIPVLRGTAVAGLLRDGLYRLLKLEPLAKKNPAKCAAQGLQGKDVPRFCGQKEPSQTDCPICRLFGSPRTSKRWHFSSARPDKLTQIVSDGWAKKQTGSQVVRRARINPRTRRAEEHKLFTHEVGDSRLDFVFTATCYELTKVERDIELLVAAARMVRHLGASRRRGQGACCIKLKKVEADGKVVEVEQDNWLDRFKQRYLGDEDQEPPSLIDIKPLVDSLTASPDEKGVRFWLLVRTEEPLLLSERSEAANQFDSRLSIPGSAVRGTFASRIAARHALEQKSQEAVYETFVNLFFRDELRFSFLYPCQHVPTTEEVNITIPAPRDLLSCELHRGFQKEQGQHGVEGYSTKATIPNCPICEKNGNESALKPLRDYFIPLLSSPKLIKPKRATEMHITISPTSGRVKTGDLYGYVALEVGQYFIGELWCANQQAWETLKTLANLPEVEQPFTLRMGKAARRGYGRMTAWLLHAEDELLWIPQTLSQRVKTWNQPFTLTLLTDTIIQDEWGRFYTGFDEAWLKAELGIEVEIIRQFVATTSVDSFNSHLGLPRQRDMALRAGSAVGLRLKGTPSTEWQKTLERLEQEGIGLRRNEGFGRIVFNHPVYQGNEDVEQYIELEGSQLLASSNNHPLSHEELFRREWTRKLNKTKWAACEDKEGHFVQVGRLLQIGHWLALETIDKMLGLLGQSGNLLGKNPFGRQKVHFFQKENEGQLGLKLVRDLLGQLEEEINKYKDKLSQEEQRRLQEIGLTMLGDKVADVAESARQQARRSEE